MTFGEKLRQARRVSGLSQEELAAALEVSRQAVSKWEMNQTYPDVDKLILLCSHFGLSADELLGLSAMQPAPDTHIQTDGRREGTAVSREPPRNDLAAAAQLGFYKRIFTIGAVTAMVGLIALIVDCFALYVVRDAAIMMSLHTMGTTQGVPTGLAHYIIQPPMSLAYVFSCTVLGMGVGLIIRGLLGLNRFQNKMDNNKI